MNDYFEVGSTDPCLIFGKTGYVRLKSSGLAESLLFVLFDLGGVYLLQIRGGMISEMLNVSGMRVKVRNSWHLRLHMEPL